MNALRAEFGVRAGVIPGVANVVRAWSYTSANYAEDGRVYQEWLAKPEAERGPMPGSKFLEMRDAAHLAGQVYRNVLFAHLVSFLGLPGWRFLTGSRSLGLIK